MPAARPRLTHLETAALFGLVASVIVTPTSPSESHFEYHWLRDTGSI
jgi:hypothetical protein